MSVSGGTLVGVRTWLEGNVFGIFEDPGVAIGLSLLLLALGVYFILLIIWRWLPASQKLKRLEGEIRKTADEREFAQAFPHIDEAMQQTSFVKHGWEEFKETVIFPEEDSESILNTERPNNYININQAEASGLHLRFLQAVPNYFVGFGLVFTFLGLVAAIYFANEGIGSNGNIATTQEALKKLLGAATFKFLTSIAGIFSSLAVAIAYRLAIGKLQKRFDRLCEALEQRLLFVTPEGIAFKQYQELQKQTVQLERFNTDLAFSIAKELDSRLTQSLPPSLEQALAPLAETMGNMADRFGEMNQDAVSDMLDRFSENLNQGAGSEMKALGDTLGETKESLAGLVGALKSAGGQLNHTLGVAGQRLESAATSMEEAFKSGISSSTTELQQQMKQISEGFSGEFANSSAKFSAAVRGVSRDAAELMKPMHGHMEELAGRIDRLSTELDSQISHIGELNTALTEVVSNTAAASDRLRDAGEPVQRASQAIGNAAESISKSTELSSATHEKLSELARQVARSVEETTEAWSEYQRRFEQVDKDLANTFKELHEGTAQQQNAIRDFVSDLDKQLDRALRNLGSGIENLSDNLEEFQGTVQEFGNRLNGGGRPSAS